MLSVILKPVWSIRLHLPKYWPTNSTAEDWSKTGHEDLLLTFLFREDGRSRRKGEIWQTSVTTAKIWPRLVERSHKVIYERITLYYATPSYPVLTTSEIPAKLLLGQKTILVTKFWPPNVKIEPIKCMKSDDNICVIFFTISQQNLRN